MEKKYQIFISSTYEDMKEEREGVAKAILEIGDIPVGMEMFSAADEAQWKLIQRQIDQSDYYIVLLAHRYGSTIENISYTEKEYDFALELGVPVLGFVIDPNAHWPADRMDSGSSKERLDLFKAKIKSRMVSNWSNSDSLNTKVLAALSKQKNLNPRPGWVRAINVPGPEILTQLAESSREIARLSEENAKLKETVGVDSKFALIDAMADDAGIQTVICMYEKDIELPKWGRYVYGYKGGGGGSGSVFGMGRDNLESAGITRSTGGGRAVTLTNEGRRFAEWLIKKKRRCDFFWTLQGGWGQPDVNSHHEKWVIEAMEEAGIKTIVQRGEDDSLEKNNES